MFNSGKIKFTLECEYRAANYGSTKDTKGLPTDLSEVSNMKVLVAIYYFF